MFPRFRFLFFWGGGGVGGEGCGSHEFLFGPFCEELAALGPTFY